MAYFKQEATIGIFEELLDDMHDPYDAYNDAIAEETIEEQEEV